MPIKLSTEYVRSAVEASPHKIAAISINDGADVIFARLDENKNLVFSKKLPGVDYSKNPKTEFGNPEISDETLAALANKTGEAIPLDFTLRFSPDRADAMAKSFWAQLEKNAGNTSNEGVIRAIEGVDNIFGVEMKALLLEQGGRLAQLWQSFSKDHPEEAKEVTKLVNKHLMGVEVEESSMEVAVKALAYLVVLGAARTMNSVTEAPIIVPKTWLEKGLLNLWAELQEAYPSTAKTLAEMLGVSPEKVLSAISRFVDEKADSPTKWATENSTLKYEDGDWVSAGKKLIAEEAEPPEADGLAPDTAFTKNIKAMIKEAVDASSSKTAIIAVRGGGSDMGRVDQVNPEAYGHVFVAYYDEDAKDYRIAEMTPNQQDRQGYLGGENDPGTLASVSRDWKEYVAVSLNLTPEQDLLLRSGILKYMGEKYSFFAQQGNTCAVLVMKLLQLAGVWDPKDPGEPLPLTEKVLRFLSVTLGLNFTHPGTIISVVKAKEGQVFNSKTFIGSELETFIQNYPELSKEFDSTTLLKVLDFSDEPDFDPSLFTFSLTAYPDPTSSLDAIATSSHGGRASRQAATDDEEGALPSKQVATASDDEDARGDDAAQQPETDDDKEASQEQEALASDPKSARLEDAAQQPETDDDKEASQEREALASDADDAAVMETAKAEEASVKSTGDDEAAAAPGQPATASADMEEGFSFSAFPKQGVTAEAAKAAMPAEQPSNENIPGSGTPASESVHADVGNEDVGNAAPSKEPVVHHSDLAP